MAKANLVASTLTAEQLARFWSYVAKGNTEDCWLWTRGLTRAGYGMFHPSHGISIYAHQITWILANGPIPDGLELCHNCPTGDNPACCNISHLWLGTHAENLRDSFAKGRMAKRDAAPVCKGGRHGNSKFTDAEVLALRAEYAAGGITQREMARRQGVSQATVFYILSAGWKHLNS